MTLGDKGCIAQRHGDTDIVQEPACSGVSVIDATGGRAAILVRNKLRDANNKACNFGHCRSTLLFMKRCSTVVGLNARKSMYWCRHLIKGCCSECQIYMTFLQAKLFLLVCAP